MSLNSCVFPSKWKLAYIVPIFKKGDKSDIQNYRPISMLNAFSKIFEKLVHRLIFREIQNKISKSQHGFYEKKSVITNLLEFTNYIFDSVDKGRQVDCIYTDFQKAFDTVSHDILVEKCIKIGLSQPMCLWLWSYLRNRTLRVKFNGCLSRTISARSGVPQGSTLGPLLFLIFINDLSSLLKCEHLFYADDLKLYRTINSPLDSAMLQVDLNNLQLWCTQNKLELNINKCTYMTFTRKKNPTLHTYIISSIYLTRVISMTDLGVIFDVRLTFDLHIDMICSKAHKLLGYIFRRSKDFRNPNTLLKIYNCLVRSILEYGSQIWNPYYDKYSDQVERVQRKLTKFLVFKSVPYTGYMSYSTRLNIFSLVSLSNRRLVLDDLLLYKIVNFKIDTTVLSELMLYIPAYKVRNNNLFLPIFSRTNIGFSNPVLRFHLSHNELFSPVDIFFWPLNKYKCCLYNLITEINN